MQKKIRAAAVAVVLAGLAAEALAAGQPGSTTAGQLYRYKNDKGVLVIESSIPPEYATKGYQIINRSGQVIQDVPPASAGGLSEEESKRKRELEAQLARKDVELRRLYSAPQDAERLRDRQLEALNIKADFVRGQLLQLTNKRKAELELAAGMERRGKPVPADLKDTIDRLNRQIVDQELQVKAVEADKEKIRNEFAPIIERLRVIYPDKAGAAPAVPATPATPATGAAAATPAVPAKPATPAAPAAKPVR